MNTPDSPIGLSRRELMAGAAAFAGAAALGRSEVAEAAPDKAPIELYENDVFLFQGDSITDAGRDKGNDQVNHFQALGRGYANMISSQLLGIHADRRPRCLNRGISGNKVPDLQERWAADTIELRPQVVSILIGVNDIWHKRNGKYDGTLETYESGLGELLAQTREALPQTRLVICEPFVLRCGAIDDSWFPEFDERRAAAKRVAEGVAAIWVPFHEMFEKATASETTPPVHWAADGVHPTMAGHALMAKTWLEVTGLDKAQPIQ